MPKLVFVVHFFFGKLRFHSSADRQNPGIILKLPKCVCGLAWLFVWVDRVVDREVVGIVLVAVGLFVEIHGVFIECRMDREVAKEGHDELLRVVVKDVV